MAKHRDPEYDAREAAEIAAGFDAATTETIERGRAAWLDLQQSPKRTLDQWYEVADAVSAARESIVRIKNFNTTRSGGFSRLMSAWLKHAGLHPIDTGLLKRLEHCRVNRAEIDVWLNLHVPEKKRLQWNHPNTLWPAFQRFQQRKDPLSVNRRTDRQQEVIDKLTKELADAGEYITELEERTGDLECELGWERDSVNELVMRLEQKTHPDDDTSGNGAAPREAPEDSPVVSEAEPQEAVVSEAEPEEEVATEEAAIVVLRQRVIDLEEENLEQAARIIKLEAQNRDLGQEVDRLLATVRSSKTVRARERERLIAAGGVEAVQPGPSRRRPSAPAARVEPAMAQPAADDMTIMFARERSDAGGVVLRITHADSDEVIESWWPDEAAARQRLRTFVDEYWEHQYRTKPPKTAQAQMIPEFFDRTGRRYAILDRDGRLLTKYPAGDEDDNAPATPRLGLQGWKTALMQASVAERNRAWEAKHRDAIRPVLKVTA